MGMYLNPGCEAFLSNINSAIYVDKTGLIGEINKVLSTNDNCIALSHARRFGKSQAADMLEAYYSSGCDTREYFEKFEIAGDPSFEKHLNKYNVIHWDVSSYTDYCGGDVVPEMINDVLQDIETDYHFSNTKMMFHKVLNTICVRSGKKFVIIIDEWDCVIRNYSDQPELVHKYMQFLHSLFKSSESKRFLALGYITGILPIKKIADESALNNFHEYTMIDSDNLTRYYGFTEEEVRDLCEKSGMPFEDLKTWYNGYLISGIHMYNPNSVNQAVNRHRIDEYWKNTSAYSTINKYITLNFDGLKDAIMEVISGGRVPVDTRTFSNDLSQINSKDDALTALIHLGYLSYDADCMSAYLPNYEVLTAFQAALATGSWKEIADTISRSDRLLMATVAGDAVYVAETLRMAHSAYTSILKYNDENSLSCVLTMAYMTAPAYYMGPFREMPGGEGYADIVFVPRASSKGKPAIIVELKCGRSAEEALEQIKSRRYPECLKGYDGEVVLVGVNYDRDTKEHECIIEKKSLGKS